MYGYIVVTVEDHRTVMAGADNGSVEPTGIKRVVKIEDNQADQVRGGGSLTADAGDAVIAVREAIEEVRGERVMIDLHERWGNATRNMTAAQMKEALAVLERR